MSSNHAACLSLQCPSTCVNCAASEADPSTLVCTSCPLPGQIIAGSPPACRSCGAGCSTCASADTCSNCRSGSGLAKVNGQCVASGVWGCTTFQKVGIHPNQSDNPKRCTGCAQGLALVNPQTCARGACAVPHCGDWWAPPHSLLLSRWLAIEPPLLPCPACARAVVLRWRLAPPHPALVGCSNGDINACQQCDEGYGWVDGKCVKVRLRSVGHSCAFVSCRIIPAR